MPSPSLSSIIVAKLHKVHPIIPVVLVGTAAWLIVPNDPPSISMWEALLAPWHSGGDPVAGPAPAAPGPRTEGVGTAATTGTGPAPSAPVQGTSGASNTGGPVYAPPLPAATVVSTSPWDAAIGGDSGSAGGGSSGGSSGGGSGHGNGNAARGGSAAGGSGAGRAGYGGEPVQLVPWHHADAPAPGPAVQRSYYGGQYVGPPVVVQPAPPFIGFRFPGPLGGRPPAGRPIMVARAGGSGGGHHR